MNGKTRLPSHRFDIEGIRALAVVSVVLYHLGVPGFAGGFVGVDVFFVLSGFLITGILCRELARTGKIHIGNFLGRRIRRLLPAAVVVSLATFVAAKQILPPLTLVDLRWDALASVTYLTNHYLIARNTDYLGQSDYPSPYQQFWSLALEEQFYVVWPLLLMLAFIIGKRRNAQKSTLFVGCVILILSSLTCLYLTYFSQPWAYFSLPSRAWEFALGGLFAVLSTRYSARLRSKFLRSAVQKVCLFSIIGSIVAFGSLQQHFPGVLAAIPTLGTAVLLYLGVDKSTSTGKILFLPAMQFVGKLSYSIYLWHWPVLTLFGGTKGGDLGWPGRILILAAILVLSYLSFHLIENPMRNLKWASVSLRRTVALAAGGSMVASGAILALAVPPVLYVPRSSAAEAFATAGGINQTSFVPENLTPPLASAGKTFAKVFSDGCHNDFLDVEVHSCEYGDVGSDVEVFLFGDSHAAHWFPAFERIAQRHCFRLISQTKSGCPSVNSTKQSLNLGRTYYECDEWRKRVINRIERENPQVVIMSNATNVYGDPTKIRDDYWLKGMKETLTRLRKVPRVVLLSDTPYAASDVPTCLSANVKDTSSCAVQIDTGINSQFIVRERQLVATLNRQTVETHPLMCDTAVCPAVLGNKLVYVDQHHLAPPFVSDATDAIERLVFPHFGS